MMGRREDRGVCMKQEIRGWRGWVAAALMALPLQLAAAESFPSKPIRLVAPFVPGGTVDAVSRALSVHLAQELGQQIVVENRSGASGNIGAESVARSPADGHTVLLTASTIIVNPLVMKEQPRFNLDDDFTPIGMVASTPLVFVVAPDSGVNNVQDFIAHAKAHPDRVNFGVGGFGSGGHLAMESFNVETGTRIPMVIYKGSAHALTDIAGGQVSAIMDPVLTTLPLVRAERLRAIAVTGERRSDLLPDVPTLKEAGVPNMDFVSWYGMWAPAGLPDKVAARLQEALAKVLAKPEVRAWLAEQGLNPGESTGAQFAGLVREERRKYARVVEQAGIEAK